jgi:hypothetical protein
MITKTDLDHLIGRTMRQLQLAEGYVALCLREALGRLNIARASLKRWGYDMVVFHNVEAALDWVMTARRYQAA